MSKWINHPWALVIGGALLAAILTEISPLHFFSRQLLPQGIALMALMKAPIQVPIWILITGPIIGAIVVLIFYMISNRLHVNNSKLISAGLCWERLPTDKKGYRPICNECGLPLQPQIVPEERIDRNGVSFQFTPDYENALHCLRCNQLTRLLRSWKEIDQEAQLFFTKLSA